MAVFPYIKKLFFHMRKRTKARQKALVILYQSEMTKRTIRESTAHFWSDFGTVDPQVKTFTERLVHGIQEHLEKIDPLISLYATNWQIKRMAAIDRNILRIGAFELLYTDDIPPKVAINEAVELAKRYGDLESSKFVNGVLDKMHKTEHQDSKKADAPHDKSSSASS